MSMKVNDTDAQLMYRALVRLEQLGKLEDAETIVKRHLYNYLNIVLHISPRW